MENNFKRMYKIMGIIGELLGVTGAVFAIIKNLDTMNNFYFLLIALLILLISVRILFIMKCRGSFESVNFTNACIAKGHVSLMLGVCIMAVAFMFANGQTFGTVLAIVLIIIAFMSVMLSFMIKTFAKLMDMVKESEKK